MTEPIQPANNFAGFHVRQVPMTPVEEAKAKVAETMRNDIREFATGNDVSSLLIRRVRSRCCLVE